MKKAHTMLLAVGLLLSLSTVASSPPIDEKQNVFELSSYESDASAFVITPMVITYEEVAFITESKSDNSINYPLHYAALVPQSFSYRKQKFRSYKRQHNHRLKMLNGIIKDKIRTTAALRYKPDLPDNTIERPAWKIEASDEKLDA